jgi:hypothetical protein
MRRWRASAVAGPASVYSQSQSVSKAAMLHVVEMRFAGENFREVMSRVRGWLNCENVQQSTFRYWLSEPDSVLRVNFEFEDQAQAFAQAFGGVVFGLAVDSRPGAPRN